MKTTIISIIFSVITLLAFPGHADETVVGQAEFQNSCAACHGMDGKGNGPFLDFLKQAPADLTQISSRNNGKFPFQQIYKIIEDPSGSRAHGNRDMPVWGRQFSQEEIDKYGPYDTTHPGLVEAKILKLVFYLATIQQ